MIARAVLLFPGTEAHDFLMAFVHVLPHDTRSDQAG